jgi:hypothetical protein
MVNNHTSQEQARRSGTRPAPTGDWMLYCVLAQYHTDSRGAARESAVTKAQSTTRTVNHDSSDRSYALPIHQAFTIPQDRHHDLARTIELQRDIHHGWHRDPAQAYIRQ